MLSCHVVFNASIVLKLTSHNVHKGLSWGLLMISYDVFSDEPGKLPSLVHLPHWRPI